MGIKEAESKYLAKQKKRRGLQKTRFYCQICERQCLDENGFKCHIKSELHMKNVKKKLEETNGDSNKVLSDYSQRMEKDFLRLLRVSHGEKLVSLNKFYQEYISNRDHVHLNSTRWKTLTGFAHYLAKTGKVRLEESSGDDGHAAVRIAYIRDQSKTKKTGNKSVVSTSNPNDLDFTEEITHIDTFGEDYDETIDAMLSRQLASAERAASSAMEVQTIATGRAAAVGESQGESENFLRKNTINPVNPVNAVKSVASLASRGKVAFSLKKKNQR